jgi:hypothetical protein
VATNNPAIGNMMAEDIEGRSRFGRGMLFGIVFSLPFWIVLIALVQLVG